MATPVNPRTVAHPFLGVRQVAYFLGTTTNRVRAMHRRGDLREATLPDGARFRPTGVLLFPASDVARVLRGERLEAFLEWQTGLRTVDFDSVPRTM